MLKNDILYYGIGGFIAGLLPGVRTWEAFKDFKKNKSWRNAAMLALNGIADVATATGIGAGVGAGIRGLTTAAKVAQASNYIGKGTTAAKLSLKIGRPSENTQSTNSTISQGRVRPKVLATKPLLLPKNIQKSPHPAAAVTVTAASAAPAIAKTAGRSGFSKQNRPVFNPQTSQTTIDQNQLKGLYDFYTRNENPINSSEILYNNSLGRNFYSDVNSQIV